MEARTRGLAGSFSLLSRPTPSVAANLVLASWNAVLCGGMQSQLQLIRS